MCTLRSGKRKEKTTQMEKEGVGTIKLKMCVYIYSLNEFTELAATVLLLRDYLTKSSVGGTGNIPSGC